jgi:uncharacterized membrane-anchored protein YhcB (DUF1043 family)
MTISEWTGVLALVVAIVIPLGTLIWAIGERARADRSSLHAKVDSLHTALDSFRVENANDLGEIRGRVQSMEARSLRVRRGDPDAREL